ncbi:MAG: Sec-dependent nitrous-oxide reductase [Armatimonadota bacterium]|nr:Sec-dependent nitrous-oxide reductase [Armatimonadota bacterium]MDR5702495.1 Sec-dependent nitrous-oxide reductase [Armatimonadota bacterium]
MRRRVKSAGILGAVTLVVIALAIVLPQLGGRESGAQEPGKAFVPPGKLDEYYMFASGGHSGQVYVFGIPSMRRIRTIPVFTPDPATGWGYDEHSKRMLGGYTWGDVHHPALSETRGEYDGRWLFVNDNANNRVARIDLKTFTVGQILGPVPNIMGPHCAAFVTPNTEYFMMPSRFSAPIPTGTYAPLSEYGKKYFGVLAAIAVDPKTGEMSVGWELLLPPWQYDLSDAGKKVSEGWAFLTTYNTEEATTVLEKNASKNDRDYIIVLNWREVEKAVKAGKFTAIAGVKVVDPTKVPGLVYLIPVAKSPHGVDVSPDGRFIVASGKLQPTVTVYEFAKIQEAIQKKDFAGTVRGLPVLNYESVRVAEVPVGLGPLHTQFDDKGFAYTSLFLDSAIAKWQLGTWKVVDKVQINYNVGHLAAAEGDSASPDGKYLVSLNKMAKDRFLSVGPSHPESLQLIDIAGGKMRVIADAPVDPEPHYAQIVKADKIKAIEIHPKETKRPNSVWSPKDARIERKGNEVHVYMYAIRSRYVPDNVEVNQGDRVFFHITNNDLDEDLTHGFGISLYNVNMEIQPGETKTISMVADKPGVYPFYCTNFCSALHQEMQGYLLVKPKK